MVINISSKTGKNFSEREKRVIIESITGLKPFLLREFIAAGSFTSFIQEMEKLEIFEWIESKKKMRYIYTHDIIAEIDLLPLFRDYQLEQILKK